MSYKGTIREELPPHQLPVKTSALIRFYKQMKMLVKAKSFTGYPMMGIVTGEAGLGKTVSCTSFAHSFDPQPHTGLPECIYFKIPPRPTPDRVSAVAAASVGIKIDPEAGTTPVEQAIEILADSAVKLIIADEADWLDEEGYEILRYIHDEAQVSVAVVGLDQLIDVVRSQEKFRSRVGLRSSFKKLDLKEVLDTVLPNLVFPYWQFDPNNKQDVELGTYLWGIVTPSLRRLREVLQSACLVADAQPEPRIDREIIDLTLEMVDFTEEDDEGQEEDKDAGSRQQGELERESTKRRQSKPRPKKPKK